MKIKSLSFAILISSIVLVSCKKTENTKETVKAETKKEIVANVPMQKETATFTVEGMSCEAGCANMLKTKLAKLDGVEKAEINFETKQATVEFNANVQKPEAFIKLVQEALDGKTYKATNLKSTLDKVNP